MKYFIFTYGCQMNVSDSERIAAIMKKRGYKPAVSAATADLIVINACSVRQKAVDRVFDKIHKFKNKKIILAGCVLEADRKKLKGRVKFWEPDEYFDTIAPLRQNKLSAFLPIMTGCNNFCSYCAVPFTRGKEKSRPAKEILNEAESLVKKGCREIILLGQNVNSYQSAGYRLPATAKKFHRPTKDDRQSTINFVKLLKMINAIPGNFRLTFLTSHPKDMSDELIKTIAKNEKIIPSIHLPVQSGDNLILRKMNRRYTTTHYKNLIKKIRLAFKKYRPSSLAPEISTDIIVGFPGETKKQFQNTFNFCKEIKFDKAYIAQYSPRPGTAAAKLKDDIPPKEKKRRWRILDTLVNKFEHLHE